LHSIYSTIRKQLETEGGKFQVYDRDGHLLASANTRVEALRALRDRLRDGSTVYYGDDVSLITIKPKKTGLEAHAELLAVLSNLDVRKVGDRSVLYQIHDLTQRGFRSDDLRKISETLLNQKFRERSMDIMKRPFSHLRGKVKTYTLEDLQKLKSWAHQRR
jgi:hypothetical protein